MLDKRCACGSQHRLIDDPVGRMDDSFTYPDGTIVHPHVFRTVLGLDPGVIEYQVQQTVSGAAIKIRGETDFERLRADIAAGLERQGLTKPQLTFTTVHEFVRQETGKLPRFLPIR
jgi:phenylacetate-coenzyme A ligase PaaK-like adenylate-forming protein